MPVGGASNSGGNLQWTIGDPALSKAKTTPKKDESIASPKTQQEPQAQTQETQQKPEIAPEYKGVNTNNHLDSQSIESKVKNFYGKAEDKITKFIMTQKKVSVFGQNTIPKAKILKNSDKNLANNSNEVSVRVTNGKGGVDVVKISENAKKLGQGGFASIHVLENAEGKEANYIQKRGLKGTDSKADMKNEAKISKLLGFNKNGDRINGINVSFEVKYKGETSLLQEKAVCDGQKAYCTEAYADNLADFEKIKVCIDHVKNNLESLTKDSVESKDFKIMFSGAEASLKKLKEKGMVVGNELQLISKTVIAKKNGNDLPTSPKQIRKHYEDTVYNNTNFKTVENIKNIKNDSFKALSINEKIEVCGEIAKAYDHIWGQGICHGDGKPQNILIGNDGKPKIADFGGAIPFSKITTKNITSAVGVTKEYQHPLFDDTLIEMKSKYSDYNKEVGINKFMSQVQNQKKFDQDVQNVYKAQEVYMAGVIMYNILTGGEFPRKNSDGSCIDRSLLEKKQVPEKLINFMENVLDPSKLGPPVSDKPGCPTTENFLENFEKCFFPD